MPKTHFPTGTFGAPGMQAAGYVTRHFALQHFKAAKYFAKQTEIIERDPRNQ
jgi:hypothetical protein